MRKWLWKGLFTLMVWVPIVFITFIVTPVSAYNYITIPLVILGYFIGSMSGDVYYKFHPDVHDKERRMKEEQAKGAEKWNNSHKRFIKIALWFIWFFVLLTAASLMGYYFNGSLLVFYFILSLWFVSLVVYLVYKKMTK